VWHNVLPPKNGKLPPRSSQACVWYWTGTLKVQGTDLVEKRAAGSPRKPQRVGIRPRITDRATICHHDGQVAFVVDLGVYAEVL